MEQATRAIPARLNLAIAAGVFTAAIALLWAGSYLYENVHWGWSLALGVVFAYLLLTNYALLHEATHDMLHPDARVNWLLGMALGWLFPVSFTVLHVTHIVHHCCNRTDHEMFDCYYAGDIKPLKYGQWYGLMLGLWWPLIPIGCVLLALTPGLLRRGVFRRARSTAVLFDDFGALQMRRIRIEMVSGALFWLGLFYALDLHWASVLIMYACFAFNWSTRQYVTHAFTPRDVKNGALNLKVGPLMQWVLLQGHWDQVHHQQPHLPWIYLPAEGAKRTQHDVYWRQYLRLWRGPRLCRERGPEVLPKNRYQAL